MKIMKKALRMSIPLVCMLALFAGPAGAFIVDGDFNASADSAALRAGGGPGQGWYESKGTNPLKVELYDGTSSPRWSNNTKMARVYNNAEATTGSAYLTQDFGSAQTGTFRISFDIAIESIYNRSGSTNTDSTGFIYVGQGIGSADGPNSTGDERFVYLGFYDAGGGETGQGIHMMANNNDVRVTEDNTLSYDTWYTITLAINVGAGTYDVTVHDKYGSAPDIHKTGISAYRNLSSLESLSFFINGPNDQFGSGEYYVDNVVPIPGAVWLLGSGLLGLVAIRRRMKK